MNIEVTLFEIQSQQQSMEFRILRRDYVSFEKRHDNLLSPTVGNNFLKLEKYEVTEKTLADVSEALSSPICIIERLELKRVHFNDTKAKILAEGIEQNGSLTQIIVQKCRLRYEQFNMLMHAVAANEALQCIKFNGVNMLERHSKSLSMVLSSNMSLKSLYLQHASLGDLAIMQIAKGIEESVCLEEIDLSHNLFEKKGLHALFGALKKTMQCKVLRLDELVIDYEDAEHLIKFLQEPRCQLEELQLHDADLKLDVFKLISDSLMNCSQLKAISFAKNYMGPLNELDYEYTVNCSTQAFQYDNNPMMVSFVQLFQTSYNQITRMCLAHCQIDDHGFKILAKYMQGTNIRYLNISWLNTTSASIHNLCQIIQRNFRLEKLLIQHNQWGDDHCMELIANAISGHQQLQYLDISAMGITDIGFRPILEVIESGKVKLHTLQCRKNYIRCEFMDILFKRLQNNKSLNVLDLSHNELVEEVQESLLAFVEKNIFIEEINLEGNDGITSTLINKIDNNCRMNVLIKEHVLPKLTSAKQTNFRHSQGREHNCAGYDVRALFFEDSSFFTTDFIFKFCNINIGDVQCLSISHVLSEQKFFHMPSYLKKHDLIKLQNLEIINCPSISENVLRAIFLALKDIKTLRELSLQNLSHVKSNLRLLTRCLKNHPSLELLSLMNNGIVNYDDIVKLIKTNDHIKILNLEGNYISEEIIEELWIGLHDNISITSLMYDNKDIILASETVTIINQELEINRQIKDGMLDLIERREKTSGQVDKKKVDLSGKEIQYESSAPFIKYLKHKKKITEINLSDSNVTSQMVTNLVKATQEGEIKFTVLNLSKNYQINDEVCHRLRRLIQEKTSMETLILDETSITHMGLSELLDSSQKNTSLMTISVNNCAQLELSTHEQSVPIVVALSHNCSITSLNLQGIQMNDELRGKITEELEMNTQIVRIIFPMVRKQEERIIRRKLVKQEKQHRASRTIDPSNNNLQVMLPLVAIQESQGSQNVINTVNSMNQNQRQVVQPLKPKHSRQLTPSNPANLLTINRRSVYAKAGNNIQSAMQHAIDSVESFASLNATSMSESVFSEDQDDTSGKLELQLTGLQLLKLDFLGKFVREFPQIHHIDLTKNQISNQELKKFANIMKENQYIQNIEFGDGHAKSKTHELIKKELEKNKWIMDVRQQNGDLMSGSMSFRAYDSNSVSGGLQPTKTLVLKDKGVSDISFVNKMLLDEDFSSLQELNLENNSLGQNGAKQVAELLAKQTSIRRVNLDNNDIGPSGLHQICSVLADPTFNLQIESLSIIDNSIPDKNLKILLAVLYQNTNIKEIKYSLYDQVNIESYNRFKEQAAINGSVTQIAGHGHAVELKLWQKIVFPVWIWKTFLHAKHEAFRFKYDSESIQLVEETMMKTVGFMLYSTTFLYYIIVFGLPFLFVGDEYECGSGFDNYLFYLYGAYAFITAALEVIHVLNIQRKIKKTEILSFNRWHVVELFMGQLARFDTFLDVCFLVMLIQCTMWNLVWPVAIFIGLNLAYPLTMVFILLRVDKSLSHTQPYMERNCMLSFIRENMLLATVLDSFCLNNCIDIFGKQIPFGKMMGTYTFLFQDFPQMSIHLWFMMFDHSEKGLVLHASKLVLLAVINGAAAIMISIFNAVMFQQNDFDPVLIEQELHVRKRKAGQSTDLKIATTSKRSNTMNTSAQQRKNQQLFGEKKDSKRVMRKVRSNYDDITFQLQKEKDSKDEPTKKKLDVIETDNSNESIEPESPSKSRQVLFEEEIRLEERKHAKPARMHKKLERANTKRLSITPNVKNQNIQLVKIVGSGPGTNDNSGSVTPGNDSRHLLVPPGRRD